MRRFMLAPRSVVRGRLDEFLPLGHWQGCYKRTLEGPMGTTQGLSRGTIVELKPALFAMTTIRRLLVQGPNFSRPVRTAPFSGRPMANVNSLLQQSSSLVLVCISGSGPAFTARVPVSSPWWSPRMSPRPSSLPASPPASRTAGWAGSSPSPGLTTGFKVRASRKRKKARPRLPAWGPDAM